MSISGSIARFLDYYRRRGFRATLLRVRLALDRGIFVERMAVFYCDLAKPAPGEPSVPDSLACERVTTRGDLSRQDFEAILRSGNSKLVRKRIEERFGKGASLWLVRSGSELAGYGWTLQGRTVERYYFPLAPDDVHLFDFHVFPQYRGRNINPYLVTTILRRLATSCDGRAFIEAASWNEAQLSSLKKTPFRPLGVAKSIPIFGGAFVRWTGGKEGQLPKANRDETGAIPTAVASRERS